MHLRLFILLIGLITLTPLYAQRQTTNVTHTPWYSNKSLSTADAIEWYYHICRLADQNTDSALREAQTMLSHARNRNETATTGFSYDAMAHIYNITGDFEQLKTYADLTLKIGRQTASSFLIANALHKTGIYYWHQGLNTKAFNTQLEALAIRERIQDIRGIATSYASLAWVAIQKDDLSKAMLFARKSLEKAVGAGDETTILRARHLLANLFGMQGQYQQALQQDSILLPVLAASGNLYGQSMVYNNMANCYAYMGNTVKAIALHQKTLEIDQLFGNSKQIGDSYSSLAMAYEQQKDNARAGAYFHKALKEFTDNGHLEGLRNTTRMLSEYYEKLNRPDSALYWRKVYEQMKDSVINLASLQQYNDLQVKYEASRKENTIQILSKENKLQTAQRQKENILYLSLIALLSIGGWGMYSFVRRRQIQQFNLTLMEEQQKRAKAVLKAEEKERERIAAELHDSIGQQMSALKMNMESLYNALPVEHEEKRQYQNMVHLIDDTIREVRGLSHNMLPPVLKNKGLQVAVQDFIDTVKRNSNIKITTDMHGLESERDAMIDFVMFRVLQEAVQNILKHSNATQMILQLVQHEDELCLMVEDDGIGFAEPAGENGQGMGLKNIRSRVQYLNGNLEIDSTPGKGTTLTVEIPLNSFINAKD